LPKGGLALLLEFFMEASASVESAEGGLRGASRELGSRAISGCSCRESVAEVGDQYLLRCVEESREANQGEPA
jgi:hypothetical protein